jgi:hypothetical protein
MDRGNSILQKMVGGDGEQSSSRKKALGVGFESRGQLGQLRRAVIKFSHATVPTQRRTIRARAACLCEILLAYLFICFVESACLFPAVWVR